MNDKKRHHIELYLAVIILGSNGFFAKLLNTPATTAIAYRVLLAALILITPQIFKRIFQTSEKSGKPKTSPHIPKLILTGALYGVHLVTYFASIQSSTVAIGMITLFTFPAMTALLEPLFHKAPWKKSDLLAAVGVFIGVYFLAPEIKLGDPISTGILLGLSSALCLSIRNILSKPLTESLGGKTVMQGQLITSSILLAPFLIPKSPIPGTDWLILIFLAIVGTIIGHTLALNTLKHFSATTWGIYNCLSPAVGILLAILFLNADLTPKITIGGTIILITVLTTTITQKKYKSN